MISLKGRGLIFFLCLAIVSGWAGNAAAHRRNGLPAARFGLTPVTQPPPQAKETGDSRSLQPESYWSSLLAQEQAKEFPEARKTGLALVNLFPQAPQRGAALLKLGELAKAQGRTSEALELFGLVSFLTPGTPEAAQARLAASALEFARDIKQSNPFQSMRFFLEKLSGNNSNCQPDALQEALSSGWQTIARQVEGACPPPLNLVEELLVLWDMQPQDVRPPEGAMLLADIMKKSGFLEEAQILQAKAQEMNRSSRQLMAKLHSSTGTWNQMPLRDEPKFPLLSWLPPWQVRFHSPPSPGEALLNCFMPHRTDAAWLAVPAPAWEQTLLYSPPPSLPECQAGRGQIKMDNPVGRDPTPFQKDRLGLSHLQEGQPEAAQAAFQELAQYHDPFWQRLAQVRLADMELSRLQTEPAP